ncbi:MAG: helix-turn-helix transcriptional regulator [Christensenellaceae bacterium]|nr:helix-turn-helix transcriptional regulator [Christensenellaceae bacterium]
MFKYHCPIEEAMIFIANVVNDETVAKLALELVENHGNISTEILRVLKPAIELEKYMLKHVTLASPRYDFFFHYDFSSDEVYHPMSTTAGLLLGHRKSDAISLPSLDEIAAQRKALSKPERLKLFYADILALDPKADGDDLFNDDRYDEERFLKFIDSINVAASVRRKVLDLYNNFDAYVDELIDLLRPVVDAVITARPLYENSLNEFEQEFDRIENLSDYMDSKYGFLLPDAESYDVYPCVLIPNKLSVKDGGLGNVEIFIGVALNAITRLLYSGRENKRLTSMLRAIADETRLEILHYLFNRPSYAFEIADTFSISPSSVSYNMNKLTLNGFVRLTLRGGKAYYEPNKGTIKSFIEDFTKYVYSPFPKKSIKDNSEPENEVYFD